YTQTYADSLVFVGVYLRGSAANKTITRSPGYLRCYVVRSSLLVMTIWIKGFRSATNYIQTMKAKFMPPYVDMLGQIFVG
ncbi:MAG: hypothetical protein ACKVE4_12395, partial [Dissulfuribacterales bacterium]